ncbi:unnamed protein product [Candidula unifasciata]|uniref:G-protein coupled receptors family 1 profile domain-containing protein n=1 Tax=Candidula unifasciata TaxID=100452 RepID=A0A8S3ZYW9_9EUPU|nr:unnamed protein product [Candidula unifasciata]
MATANSSESTLPTLAVDDGILVSDKMLTYFTMINTLGIGQSMTILGLIVNILNIIVFVRQGLQDPVNISLLGLSISDFGSLFFHFFANLSWMPDIQMLDLPFYPGQFSYFFVWIHMVFTRVTTGTTAWITFERCLCIVVPMKIKSIVTPRRTILFIVVLNVIMFASVAPVLYTTQFIWMFDSHRNKSILGIMKTAGSGYIQNIAFWINNILPTIFFIFITICTFILVKSLQKHAKWKEQTVSSPNQKDVSNRDTKVAKMVSIISIVFIFCYAPGTILFIFFVVFPELTFAGKQRNLLVGIFTILLQLEVVNATANFFIYLSMSSRFKSTFKDIFCGICSAVNQTANSNVPTV